MKKEAIRAILMTVILTGSAAKASLGKQVNSGAGGLQLIESLPVNSRAHYYKAIAEFLKLHPELANDASIFAIDNKGSVYVLDKSMVQLASFGAPSCCE